MIINDLSLDIFVDHINLLYDKELEAKMDRLLRIGKSALDLFKSNCTYKI